MSAFLLAFAVFLVPVAAGVLCHDKRKEAPRTVLQHGSGVLFYLNGNCYIHLPAGIIAYAAPKALSVKNSIIREVFRASKHYRFLQYGGPDGEMGASLRYLSQRYAMPYKECKGALTDIGTEE